MPKKSKADFEKWRDRIGYARDVWVNKGLIGLTGVSQMRMLIEFYRSNQWKTIPDWAGLSDASLMVVNKIFPTANAMQGELAARNPRMQYFARNEDSSVKAPVIETLHNYDIREQNHIVQLNAAFRDHQFAPFGAVRHGYTPNEERIDEDGRLIDIHQSSNPNRPWIRRTPPWNVLFDPTAQYWTPDGGMKWVAFRDIYTLDQIKRNPNMTARKQLEGFQGNVSPEWDASRPGDLLPESDPDRNTYIELWTVYEVENRTTFQLTLDGVDDFIRAPEDWRINWEWLPVSVFQVNHQMDTPMALSLMEDILPLQIEKNKVRTMIAEFAKRIRRVNIVNQTAFERDEIDRMVDGDLVEWFLAKGPPAESFATIQNGTLPQELLLYDAHVDEDIRESVGQSKMSRGQRINVETAAEANRVGLGDDINSSRIEDVFLRFVGDVEGTYMQGRRIIMAATGVREAIRIVGSEEMDSVVSWSRVGIEDIHGEYEFEVEPGSTRRKSRSQESQLAASDLALGLQVEAAVQGTVNIPYLFRRYLDARGVDPSRALTPNSQSAARLAAVTGISTRVMGALSAEGKPQPAPNRTVDPSVIQALSAQTQ